MSEAHKIVCHAPGDTCLGCGHYRGELSDCEHKRGQPESEAESVATTLESSLFASPLTDKAAALIRRLAAENAALKAQLKQEQEDCSEMLLIAHLDGLTKNREAHAKELAAQAERIAKLEEALADCIETLALVEEPAFVDPAHGETVRQLGERIGYGALMASASASWRQSAKSKGYPEGGEFVAGPCFGTVVATLRRARAAMGPRETER
jgi:hypothetical protein